MSAFASILFDGFAYGMLLFTITVGLSITMGVLQFTNLAHGAFAMFGGYLAVVLVNSLSLNFILAILVVFLLIGLLGFIAERLIFRHFYTATPLRQVLLTIGIVFMSVAVMRYVFGPLSVGVAIPAALETTHQIGGVSIPAYRMMLLAFGLTLGIVLWVFIDRTLIGAKLRAAVSNRNMAEAVGIDVPFLFAVVFSIGAGLAGVGGALSVEVLGLTPTYAFDYLSLVLLVVIVGGLGSIRGAFVGSLFIGVIDNAGKFLFPEVGAFLLYLITFAILLWRPQGLLPKS